MTARKIPIIINVINSFGCVRRMILLLIIYNVNSNLPHTFVIPVGNAALGVPNENQTSMGWFS